MSKKHGGKRNGAGRKPVEDKAIQLNIYPRESVVDAIGGTERAKVICINALNTASKKILKKT